MIWIIGGTSEARKLVQKIKYRDDYIVTAATEGEKQFIDASKLKIERMNFEDMIQFVENNNINLIVDVSHPYADIVTQNARKVSQIKNIRYLRYTRPKTYFNTSVEYVKTLDECLNYLKSISGTVFFTTGSKKIKDFEKVKGKNRFVYRVLPLSSSILECEKNNVLMKDIVAILGPFSQEMNTILFKQYKADYVVMKDSGKAGGTLEKINACESLNIIPIIIGRCKEKGFMNLDEIQEIIKNS